VHRKPLVVVACLALMAFLPGPAPASGDDQGLPAKIDALLTPLYGGKQPGAVVLVAREGKVIHHEAYGLADLELEVPMAKDSVFKVASITKLFTAVAVMKLEGEGKLRLDDEIVRFLPDYPARGRKITLRQLLTHTSGIPMYLDHPDVAEWIRQERTIDEVIDFFKDRELDFEPGTAAAYSPSNYVLLAAVIEKASGKSYPEVLREVVFEPAGMADTRCGDDFEIVPRRARGYTLVDGAMRNERFYSMTILRGGGDVLSTAGDLHRFFDALFAGKLIPKERVERSLQSARLSNGRSTRFGEGWELDRIGSHRAALKGGAISGFCHYVGVLPDDGIQVILLTNRGPEEARRPGRLMLQIGEMALDG
jgi:CubicO group peptidase (beta-lactamase class C family)